MDDYDTWNESMLDVTCSRHGRSRSHSGDCIECLREADMEAAGNEGPHGLCGSCAHADGERSSSSYTWCTAWKPTGFPCRPRVKKCCKRQPIRDMSQDEWQWMVEWEARE